MYRPVPFKNRKKWVKNMNGFDKNLQNKGIKSQQLNFE